MNIVQTIVEKHTRDLPLMERVYLEELPNPELIAKELGQEGVVKLFEEIASVSAERKRLDRSGEVNCDELDDYWRATTRLASVIPYQARLYPDEVLKGLLSESEAVRFYVAYCLSKVPFHSALPQLKAAISKESDQLNIEVLNNAVSACSSFLKCSREQIAKLRNTRVVW